MEGISPLPPRFCLARSATEALDRVARQSFLAFFFDIATCDDGSNGYRLTRQLRRIERTAPIYLLAMSPTPTIEALALASGATAAIPRNLAAIRGAFAAVAPASAAMDSGTPAELAPAMPAELSPPADAAPELAGIAACARRLLPSYVGPAASLMVADALDRVLSSTGADRGPVALKSIIAANIGDPFARKRFLDQLALNQEPHR